MSNHFGGTVVQQSPASDFASRDAAPFLIRINGVNITDAMQEMRGPYDEIISSAMQSTMKFLCELIPGCSFGYTYSDKIILMIFDMERMPGRQKDIPSENEVNALAASVFNAEFRYWVECWMIDEGIRIPMDTLRRDPSFCPSEEVLRLEKVYVSWFDKAEFTASITPGSKESFYDAFLCEQNSAVTQHLAFRTDGPVASPRCARGACCYYGKETESQKIAQDNDNSPLLSESFREGGQEIGWVVDENPPDFRINKDYVMR